MRALSRVLVAACAILTLSFCDASSVAFRAKRGVVPGNAASRPKDAIRRSECRNDNNCKPWPKTSCGKDPVDGQQRCLCADQTHPINDDCITSPQELGMPCEKDIQCIQLAHCTHNVSEIHSDIKVCQCREEFADEDGTCSGGVRAVISICLAVLVAAVLQNNYN
ncbi:PREDICTED: uncharacterized protein LOC107162262 [Diuraphis noxia]|uniref:uncharacterized protein LOC107162262 n=1 Tax=Diuraphis noxia TaxID=143948 RepID=UPI00076396D1|nr:PREDICTED: uncharacterized protein LOC107162262 [Diuraphis noxia]